MKQRRVPVPRGSEGPSLGCPNGAQEQAVGRRELCGGVGGAVAAAEQEVRRLQRELSLVREERDILKKALAIFSDRRR